MKSLDKKALNVLRDSILTNRWVEYNRLKDKINTIEDDSLLADLTDALRDLEDRITNQISDMNSAQNRYEFFNENPYKWAKREWVRQKLRGDAINKVREEMRLSNLIPKRYKG